MRIRNPDFLTHIQCWGSVTFWCGSGSPDPYLLLMDPDIHQDPTPGPTPFFSDFKDAKNWIFFIVFSFTVPSGILSSVLLALFQSAQHLYEKSEGAGSGSIPLTNGSGSGSGRPKNIRIRIPNTAQNDHFLCNFHFIWLGGRRLEQWVSKKQESSAPRPPGVQPGVEPDQPRLHHAHHRLRANYSLWEECRAHYFASHQPGFVFIETETLKLKFSVFEIIFSWAYCFFHANWQKATNNFLAIGNFPICLRFLT